MSQNNKNRVQAVTDFGSVNQPDVLSINETIASELATVSVSGYMPIETVPNDMRWGNDLREFLLSISMIDSSYGSALAVLEKSTAGEKFARDIGNDHDRIEHLNGKVGGMSLIIKNLLAEKDLLLGGMKLLFNELKALDLLQREHPELVQQYHDKIHHAEIESKKVLSTIDKITKLVDGLDEFDSKMEPKQREVLLAHASALDQLTAENLSLQALHAQQGAAIREIVGNESHQPPEEITGIDVRQPVNIEETQGPVENIGPEQEESESREDAEEGFDEKDAETSSSTEEKDEEEDGDTSAIDDMIDKVLAPKKKEKKE